MVNYRPCVGLCKKELGGIKKFITPETHPGTSMYLLGYSYCPECDLYFDPKTQIGMCKCCKSRIRTRPRGSRTKNVGWELRRELTRY